MTTEKSESFRHTDLWPSPFSKSDAKDFCNFVTMLVKSEILWPVHTRKKQDKTRQSSTLVNLQMYWAIGAGNSHFCRPIGTWWLMWYYTNHLEFSFYPTSPDINLIHHFVGSQFDSPCVKLLIFLFRLSSAFCQPIFKSYFVH